MAIVTPSGPLRSLTVIAACIVGGIVGALLHGAVYEKHGWFSGFGFAFGAVAFGLVASVVVDFVLPLIGYRWSAPPPAAAPAQPASELPPPQHYAATIFSLRLLLAVVGAAGAAALSWAILKGAGLAIDVPSEVRLLFMMVAAIGGGIAGWWAGLALSRALDLTVE